jgi:hypothetical protein
MVHRSDILTPAGVPEHSALHVCPHRPGNRSSAHVKEADRPVILSLPLVRPLIDLIIHKITVRSTMAGGPALDGPGLGSGARKNKIAGILIVCSSFHSYSSPYR